MESVKRAIAIAMKSMSGLFLPSPMEGFMVIHGLNHLFLVSHLQPFSPTVFWGEKKVFKEAAP